MLNSWNKVLHKKRAIRIRLRSKSIILGCYLVFDLSNLDFFLNVQLSRGRVWPVRGATGGWWRWRWRRWCWWRQWQWRKCEFLVVRFPVWYINCPSVDVYLVIWLSYLCVVKTSHWCLTKNVFPVTFRVLWFEIESYLCVWLFGLLWCPCRLLRLSHSDKKGGGECKLKRTELDYVEQKNVLHILIDVRYMITSLLWSDDVSDYHWAQNITLA